MTQPNAETPPQRFRFRKPGYARWVFGVCFWFPAFEVWFIETAGYRKTVLAKSNPMPAIRQLIGYDIEFEWIDNDMGWAGSVVEESADSRPV